MANVTFLGSNAPALLSPTCARPVVANLQPVSHPPLPSLSRVEGPQPIATYDLTYDLHIQFLTNCEGINQL